MHSLDQRESSYTFLVFAVAFLWETGPRDFRGGRVRHCVLPYFFVDTKFQGHIVHKTLQIYSKVGIFCKCAFLKMLSNCEKRSPNCTMTYMIYRNGMLVEEQRGAGEKFCTVQFSSASRPSTKYFIRNTGTGSAGRSCH